MSKDKFWIGEGVLSLKDGKTSVSPGEKIPEGGISAARMKHLSEAGWVGGVPVSAASPDLEEALAETNGALKASAAEVKKLSAECDQLKEANNQLMATITELQEAKTGPAKGKVK